MSKMTQKDFARKGGQTILAKYGKAHFSKLGKLSAKKKKKRSGRPLLK